MTDVSVLLADKKYVTWKDLDIELKRMIKERVGKYFAELDKTIDNGKLLPAWLWNDKAEQMLFNFETKNNKIVVFNEEKTDEEVRISEL